MSFLVKNPANYHFEQIWTNKGLEKAIEILKANGFKVVSDRFAALS